MALKHWSVRLNNGEATHVEAYHGYVSDGVLIFSGPEIERTSPRDGKPLAPRLGAVIEAFAAGQWEHVKLIDGEVHDA